MRNQASFVTLAAVVMGTVATGVPAALRADVVHADDVIISKGACIGSTGCASGHAFAGDLELVSLNPEIIFFDTSTGSGDWEIEADVGNLQIKNHVNGGPIIPVVRVIGGAPFNSLVVGSSGRIGLGTSTPAQELHIASTSPAIQFDDTNGNHLWTQFADSLGFVVQDTTAFTNPFGISTGAPSNSLRVTSSGAIGLGTSTPDQVFHIKHTGHILPLFETTNGGAIQMRMKSSSSNRRFVALNGANVVQSQIVFGDNGRFDFLGQTVADVRMSIDAAGNLTVPGTCRDGNGGGGGADGCDAVFDPSYELPSIEEHAAYMWRHKHLPAVGPTPEGERISLSVQQRHFAVLNELEKAHIYIEQLHEEAKRKDERTAALEKSVAASANALQNVLGRLAALESR